MQAILSARSETHLAAAWHGRCTLGAEFVIAYPYVIADHHINQAIRKFLEHWFCSVTLKRGNSKDFRGARFDIGRTILSDELGNGRGFILSLT